ncbi:DUF1569 domain-containing protein [Paucibacter sp. APW11]|uniref:DUF1569 domain-containing protein n=1 Tax=Roseateles aquae TaxID=3077235 RepID=A0ABU3PD08_9BURK|nr:DUF1569 domain-containing protein [Paucibacter sp. APW11]MDT9000237.1 DUF1569 domain-containing protein [Paucibacter sp. APW11]
MCTPQDKDSIEPRRRWLLAAGLLPSTALLSGCQGRLPEGFQQWKEAQTAVLELRFRSRRHEGDWTLPQTLIHLAQSIEYSISGYPEAKPAWFQATLGKTAFALFDARGEMSHNRDEPIPGAPALDREATLKQGVQRLLDAMEAFAAYTGPLKPHFAYGQLDRAAYERAHLMHLANHWERIKPAAS